MAQQLRILQSLWAMERRRADEPERSIDRQLAMIRDAGFDGAGVRFIDPAFATDVTSFLRAHGMIWQAQCYPTSVDDLKPVLELVGRCGADHVNLQPNVRPQRLEARIPLLEGWRRLADEAGVAVHVEIHRDRMTTDLFFTLQLLDCFPDLRLTADVSHYLVGREFAWPVDEVNHAMIRRILDNSWGIHGRIAAWHILRDGAFAPPHQDEDRQTLMVRSAATSRVSNHVAHWMRVMILRLGIVFARNTCDEAIQSFCRSSFWIASREPVIGRAFARPVGSQ